MANSGQGGEQCHDQQATEAAETPEASDDSVEEIIRVEEDPAELQRSVSSWTIPWPALGAPGLESHIRSAHPDPSTPDDPARSTQRH
ncbi:hypothetical protein LA080_014012 [Diaporthe eres]|nr:hypothetical protein LA080_014012 [Diaporthe eres]